MTDNNPLKAENISLFEENQKLKEALSNWCVRSKELVQRELATQQKEKKLHMAKEMITMVLKDLEKEL